jgi:hypothetical protein
MVFKEERCEVKLNFEISSHSVKLLFSEERVNKKDPLITSLFFSFSLFLFNKISIYPFSSFLFNSISTLKLGATDFLITIL